MSWKRCLDRSGAVFEFCMSRVPDQNGVSLLCIMLEIHILVGNPWCVSQCAGVFCCCCCLDTPEKFKINIKCLLLQSLIGPH